MNKRTLRVIARRVTGILAPHLIPLTMSIAIVIAFSTPGRTITFWDIIIGVVVGYYLGRVVK
jgi:peptidoglycan/LPS O-acetylase OafA/YrhL